MADSNYYATDTETGESRPLNQRYIKYEELGVSLESTCNTLWSWGWNCNGENATDKDATFSECSPVQDVTSSSAWIEIGGIRSTIGAIKNDGTLWMWGRGFWGELGDGNTPSCRSSPVQEYCSDTNWIKVCGGASISHGLKADGSLWSWGLNNTGKLAIGSTTLFQSCSPIQEYTSSSWIDVFTSDSAIFGIKDDSSLWGWGNNGNGDLALGYACVIPECSPVREYTSSSWVSIGGIGSSKHGVKTNGTLWSWGYGNGTIFGLGCTSTNICFCSPVQEMCSSTNWCQLSASLYSVYAVKTDGTMWSWGSSANPNNGGSCSPIQEFCSFTNWICTTAGPVNGHGIRTDGTLWSWGGVGITTGTLGNGTLLSSQTPVQEFYSDTNWYKVSGKSYGANALRITG